ncbi:hypothetical protein CJ030_MR5G010190 [Morella rubra]|uniref:Uncharacterized protein n=1 Tax=Morella rubra TaxID=262757 RepID=A0A6A1VPT3_9ROSI|nr:hypothetical protein CJ030_MR5G010190 [Morella rubra]
MLVQNICWRACTFKPPSLINHLHTSNILSPESFQVKGLRATISVAHGIQQDGGMVRGMANQVFNRCPWKESMPFPYPIVP